MKTRQAFSMIETLTTILIIASLTVLTINANENTAEAANNFSYTALEQEAVKAFDKLNSDLTQNKDVIEIYETTKSIVKVSETEDDCYLIQVADKNLENETVASLNTCNVKMRLKVNIESEEDLESLFLEEA
jgi:Tfp pilus assembly protein PilV